MQTPETILTDTPKPACDGDKDSGHPRVFLKIGAQGSVDCPYCGKRYVMEKGAANNDH